MIIIETLIIELREDKLNYYLNGGCYIFANKLKGKIGGEIKYLLDEYHFILKKDDKLYDAFGNVTKKYRNSRIISEEDALKRKKIIKSIKIN